MRKRLFPIALAVPLLLAACGGSSADDHSISVDEWAGRMACIQAFDDQNEKTANMPVAAHAPNALFRMHDDGDSGSMEWVATVYTHAGIPWDHDVSCVAQFGNPTPEVTYLHAEISK